jgi:hypothetical protein
MRIALLNFKQVHLKIAFRTQINLFRPIIPNRNAQMSQILSQVDKTAHNVDKLTLREDCLLMFLFVQGLLQCEVVVVAECVRFFVFYAHVRFYYHIKCTFY